MGGTQSPTVHSANPLPYRSYRLFRDENTHGTQSCVDSTNMRKGHTSWGPKKKKNKDKKQSKASMTRQKYTVSTRLLFSHPSPNSSFKNFELGVPVVGQWK